MPNGLRALALAGAAALVAFHAALLARRLAEPGGLDAAAAWRWAGALLVLVACFALRAAAGRLEPRQLAALALAALALHAPVLQGPAEAERAAEFWFALPSVLGPALVLCAIALCDRGSRGAAHAACFAASRIARPADLARAPFSARPPPLL